MKNILAIIFFLVSTYTYAGDGKGIIKCIGDSYQVTARKSDKSLKPNKTKAFFTFKNQSGSIVTSDVMVSWKTDSLKLHPNKKGETSMVL
ncbi:MAG TPA: hypothetical protein VD905_02000, partial [Flavobacteriales bacterium]|nr:hypothetical protein [Flavobacteriales bacterium]